MVCPVDINLGTKLKLEGYSSCRIQVIKNCNLNRGRARQQICEALLLNALGCFTLSLFLMLIAKARCAGTDPNVNVYAYTRDLASSAKAAKRQKN